MHFEIGYPDFTTPSNIIEVCIDSLKKGEIHYSTADELAEFREMASIMTEL